MNDKPSDKIVELIRKILSRTESSGCTPAEAEAAFAKASRMLAEHNLTMEDCQATIGSEESWLEEEVHETGRWSLEDNLCYGILKNYYFVEGFFNYREGRKVFLLFGKAENVAVGRFVWSTLHASFDRCWTMYRYLNKRPASEKRLFVAGMARGFSQKLKEEREAQEIERDIVRGTSGGTALVLASIAEKTLAKYKEAHPTHKANKSHYSEAVGDTSTLRAGIEAGRALNLSRALGANGQKRIGGR